MNTQDSEIEKAVEQLITTLEYGVGSGGYTIDEEVWRNQLRAALTAQREAGKKEVAAHLENMRKKAHNGYDIYPDLVEVIKYLNPNP